MYLQSRQKVLLSIVEQYRKRADIESFSAVALGAYMLSSQVLIPNKKLLQCRKFVNKFRCKSSPLRFLPGQFKVVNNIVSFRGRLAKKYLDKQFPRAKLLTIISQK